MGVMQDKRLARIDLSFSFKNNPRHAARGRVSFVGDEKPIQVIRCHFIDRGDYLLRVSLKRGPQVSTCAFNENTGVPRTRVLMGVIITDSLEKSKNICPKLIDFNYYSYT